MISSLKSMWHQFKNSNPGSRFCEHYERTHNHSGKTGSVIHIMAAVVCIAIGMVLTIFPGPAILFFVAACILLASESRRLAHIFDRTEIRLRKWWADMHGL